MSAPEVGDNRRKSERRILRIQAIAECPGHQPLAIRTLDISAGGMVIVAPLNLKPGSTFQIRLNLPVLPVDVVPFAASVKVMYSVFSSAEGGFKISVAFTYLHPASSSALTEYFNSV